MQTYSSEALERGLKLTLLNRQIATPAELVRDLCEVVPSEGSDEKHEWLGDPPVMEEHKTDGKGPRKITQLSSTGYTITNKVYDASVQFGRDDMRRNRSGSFMKQVNKLADVALHFPNKRITDIAVLGTTDLCYDGTAFFGDTHPIRKGEAATQDNLYAGTGTTDANLVVDVGTVLAGFKRFIGESGDPFFADIPLELFFMVPPALEMGFRRVLNAALIGNNSNVLVGLGKLYPNQRLSDTNDWYAFVTNPGWRPFIFQPETSLEVDVVSEGSELWKRERKGEFIVSQALGAGYGFWQSAIKVVN